MGNINKDRSFENSVFINCPFEPCYEDLFKAVFFTVIACGFNPVSALDENDGGLRIEKIKEKIEGCQYGIHDISLIDLDEDSKLPRFNMPFELGLDFGCKTYGGLQFKKKNFLIFESSRYKLQVYLSDLAGCDPRCHNRQTEMEIREIRKWLNSAVAEIGRFRLPGEKIIKEAFDRFLTKFPSICADMKVDVGSISHNDLLHAMRNWIYEYDGIIPRET